MYKPNRSSRRSLRILTGITLGMAGVTAYTLTKDADLESGPAKSVQHAPNPVREAPAERAGPKPPPAPDVSSSPAGPPRREFGITPAAADGPPSVLQGEEGVIRDTQTILDLLRDVEVQASHPRLQDLARTTRAIIVIKRFTGEPFLNLRFQDQGEPTQEFGGQPGLHRGWRR